MCHSLWHIDCFEWKLFKNQWFKNTVTAPTPPPHRLQKAGSKSPVAQVPSHHHRWDTGPEGYIHKTFLLSLAYNPSPNSCRNSLLIEARKPKFSLSCQFLTELSLCLKRIKTALVISWGLNFITGPLLHTKLNFGFFSPDNLSYVNFVGPVEEPWRGEENFSFPT